MRRGRAIPVCEPTPGSADAVAEEARRIVERSLSAEDRRALGAHFTPRAYVERLVRPALEEPLSAALEAARAGDRAAERLLALHEDLCGLRVLDPACGTGNFLYVALERLRAVEREVLDAIAERGAPWPERRVSASQMIGIDRNPQALALAREVIAIAERDTRSGEPRADARGSDEDAKLVCGDALLAPWPEADIVLGNPPFLGQQRLRAVLGDAYVEALRAAHPGVPETVDLVMYFWHRAAELLREGRIRRFGLITTSSVAQPLNRAVTARHLAGDPPLSIAFAIPDHPWSLGEDGAAVRVAMTVVAPGRAPGALCRVVREEPVIALDRAIGVIHADLTIGADAGAAAPLRAMRGLARKGFELGSQGFLVDRGTGEAWIAQDPCLGRVLRPYMNGNDLKRGRWDRWVIDFHGLDEGAARAFGPAFRSVEARVRQDREGARDAHVERSFWLFRRSGVELRAALAGLPRFIGTTRTASHRVFQFLPAGLMAESKIVVVASDDAFVLGVLSARPHAVFAERIGGRLGKGNDPTYNHVSCFEAFPFPACDEASEAAIRALGEALDEARKRAQAEDPRLSMTSLYRAIRERASAPGSRAASIAALHDALDRALLAAYGLPGDASDEAILGALVALNAERAAEERRGIVRPLSRRAAIAEPKICCLFAAPGTIGPRR